MLTVAGVHVVDRLDVNTSPVTQSRLDVTMLTVAGVHVVGRLDVNTSPVTQSRLDVTMLTVTGVHIVGRLHVDEAGCVALAHDGPETLVLRVDGQRPHVLAEVLQQTDRASVID